VIESACWGNGAEEPTWWVIPLDGGDRPERHRARSLSRRYLERALAHIIFNARGEFDLDQDPRPAPAIVSGRCSRKQFNLDESCGPHGSCGGRREVFGDPP